MESVRRRVNCSLVDERCAVRRFGRRVKAGGVQAGFGGRLSGFRFEGAWFAGHLSGFRFRARFGGRLGCGERFRIAGRLEGWQRFMGCSLEEGRHRAGNESGRSRRIRLLQHSDVYYGRSRRNWHCLVRYGRGGVGGSGSRATLLDEHGGEKVGGGGRWHVRDDRGQRTRHR